MAFEIRHEPGNPARPWAVHLGKKKVKGAAFLTEADASHWVNQYRNYQFLD